MTTSDAAAALGARALQVGIVPTDLARSMTFYRDVLGLEYAGPLPVGEGRTLHNFRVGDAILKLIESSGVAAPQAPTVEPDEHGRDPVGDHGRRRPGRGGGPV